MDNKKPLSQVNQPYIRASEWFTKFDKLPKDVLVDDESIELAMKKLKEPTVVSENSRAKLVKPIGAAEWFAKNRRMPIESDNREVNDTLGKVINETKSVSKETSSAVVDVQSPKKIDVNVTVKADTPSGELVKQQQKMDGAKEKSDGIDKLIESILGLTEEIQEDRRKSNSPQAPNPVKPPLSENQEKEKSPANKKKDKSRFKDDPKSYKDLSKKIVKEKIDETKGLFTVRNALVTSGMHSAMEGTGSILDKVLTFREDKKAEEKALKNSTKKESTKEKDSTTKKESTKEKDSTTKKESTKEKDSTTKKESTKEKDSTTKKEKSKEPVQKKTPEQGLLDALSPKEPHLEKAAELIKKTPFLKKIAEKFISPQSRIGGILQDLKVPTPSGVEPVAEIGKDLRPKSISDSILGKFGINIPDNVKEAIRNPSTPEHSELISGVKDGMRDELLNLNKEQLDQLKKVVSAITASSLEEKEKALEAMDQKPTAITTKKEEKKEEKSLMSSLMESFGKLKGMLGSIGGLFSRFAPLLKLAGGAAAVGAAGYAGYKVGSAINDNVISPVMEKITGNKGETLGTAAYGAVEKVKGWFGSESFEDKMKKQEEKEKQIAIAGQQKRLKAEPVISDKVRQAAESPLKILRGTDKEPITEKLSVMAGKVDQVENKEDSTVSKDPNTFRVNQIERVQSTIKETQRIKDQKSSTQTSGNIVDARSTVTNNSTNVQNIRPPVRNSEPTFNNLLVKNFSH